MIPKILPRLLCSVGGMEKQAVRQIAREKGLNVFRKKDSTGICFVGSGGYSEFIERERKDRPVKDGRH